MSTTTQITLDQYFEILHKYDYEPEYDDGQLIERPMPTKKHSEMQRFLILAFEAFRSLGLRSYPEWTVAPTDISRRIPDVCLCATDSETPLLCVEILSPEDKASVLMKKIAEYLDWGVEYVWVIDPIILKGEVHTKTGIERVSNGIFRAGQVEVNVTRID